MPNLSRSAFGFIVVVLASMAASAENRLVNPGFEEIAGSLPVSWELFIMPMEGASGTLDRLAFEGLYSIRLHIPRRYEQEPINNWSQSVRADTIGGKNVTVSGHIRTEGAGEASLWLQCWERNPPRVIAGVSTQSTNPLRGVNDWDHVKATLTVPATTDYLVVRCVFVGVGTAWYDNVALDVETAVPDKPETASASEDAAKNLLEMQDELEALRETNDSLREQIEALTAEISTIKNELRDSVSRPIEPRVPTPTRPDIDAISPRSVTARPPTGPHPLVPRGYQPGRRP